MNLSRILPTPIVNHSIDSLKSMPERTAVSNQVVDYQALLAEMAHPSMVSLHAPKYSLGECLAVKPSQCSISVCMDYESMDEYDVRQQLDVWLTSKSRRPPSASMLPAGVGMRHA